MCLYNTAHQQRNDSGLFAQLRHNVGEVSEAQENDCLVDGIVRQRPERLHEDGTEETKKGANREGQEPEQ